MSHDTGKSVIFEYCSHFKVIWPLKSMDYVQVDDGDNRGNVLVQWCHTDRKLLITMRSINKSEERVNYPGRIEQNSESPSRYRDRAVGNKATSRCLDSDEEH